LEDITKVPTPFLPKTPRTPKPFFQAVFNPTMLKFKEKQLLLTTKKHKNNCNWEQKGIIL
jgi:hypothetical protein